MSKITKRFNCILGKRFLKISRPDSVWLFAKISSKSCLSLAWATIKGDNWYDKVPGDRSFLWAQKLELEFLTICGIFIGRFMIGCIRTKEVVTSDLFFAIQNLENF